MLVRVLNITIIFNEYLWDLLECCGDKSSYNVIRLVR